MLLITTSILPQGIEIKESFSVVMATHSFQISKKSAFSSLFGSNKEESIADVMNDLIAQCPGTANAIIGIQISTTSQQLSDGAFLYITAIGTPVNYGRIERV